MLFCDMKLSESIALKLSLIFKKPLIDAVNEGNSWLMPNSWNLEEVMMVRT